MADFDFDEVATDDEPKSQQTPRPVPAASKSQNKLYFSSQFFLRVLVFSTTLPATWIIMAAKQSIDVFGVILDARYIYSPAFRFFAIANAIACPFSLVSVLFLWISSRLFQKHAKFILFLHDLFMMVLVLSGCVSATAVGYVGKYGNVQANWLPICNDFTKFCHSVTVSVVLSYVAAICLFILTIISATTMSRKLIPMN